MISSTLLLDAAPIGTGIGIVAGVIFFVVLAIVAFFAFMMLKKTLKMAFRMAIVGVILLIAIAGSIAIYVFGVGVSSGGKGSKTPERPKASQPK